MAEDTLKPVIEGLHEASFKGAAFLLQSHSVEGGRKNVVHEFVNSDRQVIEDLGYRRRIYNINAIITSPDYDKKKKLLISKLEQSSSGTLVHPFFGTIRNIKPIQYSFTEELSSLGIATFSIKFSGNSFISIPTKKQLSTSEADTKKEESAEKTKEDLKDKWKVVEAIENAVDKIKAFGERMEAAADKAKEKIDGALEEPLAKIDEFNAKINFFKDAAALIAQDADKLAQEVDETFFNLETALDSAEQNFDSLKELFGFGEDDEEQLNLITSKQNEINNNNNLFNDCINLYALAFAYSSFLKTDTTNSTIEEIQFQENILEQQYDKVILNTFQNRSLSLSTINSLTSARDTFNAVIKEIKTNLPNIEPVEILSPLPLRVIEYKYYGRTDRFDILKSINENPNIEFYQGEVNLLNDNS